MVSFQEVWCIDNLLVSYSWRHLFCNFVTCSHLGQLFLCLSFCDLPSPSSWGFHLSFELGKYIKNKTFFQPRKLLHKEKRKKKQFYGWINSKSECNAHHNLTECTNCRKSYSVTWINKYNWTLSCFQEKLLSVDWV